MKMETLDTSSLEMFIGYNAKRVSFVVMNTLVNRLHEFGLQGPIDYSVLNLIGHNAGITSRQLCSALCIYPPNLVGIVRGLEDRNLLEKRQHPTDRRAQGLYLTQLGFAVQADAEQVVAEVDVEVASALTASERHLLNKLLRKIWVSDPHFQKAG